jgi:hypothetical protein
VSKRKAPAVDPVAQVIDTAQLARERSAELRANRSKAEAKAVTDRMLTLEATVNWMHAAPAHPPVILTPRSRPKSGLRTATPVFMASDWHFGEQVTLAETLGKNEYNLAIAATRAAKYWENILWLRKDMSRTQACDDTLLNINGDMCSGDIHDELRETNDGGLRDQCDATTTALIPGVAALADATPGILHITCIGGNHGRLTHKQHIKNGTQHSVEHIGIYDPLRRYFDNHPKYRGGKIAWHIPRAERHIVVVHGRRVSMQHGTMIKSQGGIGGTLVPMTRWVTRANDADLYMFGHFHEADAYGKIVKNGSLIGPSAYTGWLGIEDRGAEQVAFVLDADRGVRRFERVSVT